LCLSITSDFEVVGSGWDKSTFDSVCCVVVGGELALTVEGSRLTEEELMAWTRERCAGFKVPRYVKFIDTFENIGMTASAKVQRNKLLAQALLDFGFSQK